MINATLQEQNEKMFDQLVPGTGKADTLGGEVLRAINRIGYRFFNDGDKAWEGYGRETVNPAVRFLHHILHHGVPATAEFKTAVDEIYDLQPYATNDDQYEALIERLVKSGMETIVTFNLGAEKNFVGDMHDYADPKEDVDDGYDDEEDNGYEDDYDEGEDDYDTEEEE
ncbi:MAG: hypothetical protein IJG38_00145 [Thermoguttaceae bacterium]|nr:hypothetical protein [Thermoguttaceae bacterium]